MLEIVVTVNVTLLLVGECICEELRLYALFKTQKSSVEKYLIAIFSEAVLKILLEKCVNN